VLQIRGNCLKNKKMSEAEIVKESIYLALMDLMRYKSFAQISITEITTKAGVSRMSYYRHYNAKDEIFDDYLKDMFKDYQKNVLNHRNNLFHATTSFFTFFRIHKVLLINLEKANLLTRLLNHFYNYIELLLNDLDIVKNNNLQIKSYHIDFITGGMFNLLIRFLRNDMKDSDTELGKQALLMIQPLIK